jgi:cell division protein FtsQ
MQPTTATPLPVDVRLMRTATRVLLRVAVLAVLAGALLSLSRLRWLDVREIRIEGEVQHNSVANIRASALPALRGNYLSMNLRDARAAFEAVPWVRRAEVQRVWPHALVVRLEEHRPVAVWDRVDGDDLLVNTQGEVFEVNLGDLEDDDRLPRLRGPQGSAAQVLAMWRQLQPVLARLDGQLVSLTLSDGGSWRAGLDRAGAILELGRGEPAEVLRRTERFVRSVGQVTAQFGSNAIEYADLRHADSYALRLAGVGTTDNTASKGR